MTKYQKWYDELIARAKERNYFSPNYKIGIHRCSFPVETHHIVPRSMGGSDEESNLAVLTLKEHYIAHYLLTKIYKENDKVIEAFFIMCNRSGRSSNTYTELRTKFYKLSSLRSKEYFSKPENIEKFRQIGLDLAKNPDYIKKVSEGVRKAYATTDLKDKISKASKGFWNNPEYVKKQMDSKWTHRTDEYRKKSSERMKIYSSLPETKKRRSEQYKTSNFNRSRKVIDLNTNEVYNSAMDLSLKLGLKYVTVKRRLYKNPHKYGYMWLDEYKNGGTNG